jgi:hypothetical protein
LFEGLAAGVRVLGSERIGQSSVLREHGRVVIPNTAAAWCRELEREAAGNGSAGEGVRLRTTRDVAVEMLAAYEGHGLVPSSC